jgi:HlyD family secretion protein
MSATVDIQTQTANNVLTIPIQAVTTRADTMNKKQERQSEEGDKETVEEVDQVEVVFVYKDGKAHMHRVKTGIQDNMYIEILEGIEEENEVITGPYRAVSKKLEDGDPVAKVDKKDLFSDEG